MKKIRKLLFLLLCISGLVFIVYLMRPSVDFPAPPPQSVQSMEDADTETPLRRAYFTNYTREQIVEHYKDQFRMKDLTLRLNYPPEDAQTLIRDQTRSYYLEELVRPFRESLYINGFVPQKAQDDIWYKGQHFEQKITIKYVPSNVGVRILFVALTFGVMGLMIKEYVS